MDPHFLQVVILPLVAGYFAGSIPFGLLIARFGGAGDVRTIGSGNIGATNVLRTGRKGLAALTLMADALKSGLVVWYFAQSLPEAGAIAGFGAFLGHIFPVWLKFKGGKGIAVYIGALIALSVGASAVFAVVWLAAAALTRYSSLAALLATLAVPIAGIWIFSDHMTVTLILAAMSVLAWIVHRANIVRLLNSTETKIGAKG